MPIVAYVPDLTRTPTAKCDTQIWFGPVRDELIRPNLVKNGGLEDWKDSSIPAQWTVGTGTIARSTDTDSSLGAFSQYSISITQTGAGFAYGAQQISIAARANTEYTVSARAKFTGTGSGAYIYYTENQGGNYTALASTASATWVRISGSFTTGASTTQIGIALVPYAVGATSRVGYFDDVYFCEGSFSPNIEAYICKGSNIDASGMGFTNLTNSILAQPLIIDHTEHSTVATMTGKDYNSLTIIADRSVLIKQRYNIPAIGWSAWQDRFFGYIVGKTVRVFRAHNAWTCKVEGDNQYYTTKRALAHTFGPTNLALNKSATANSTLATPASEAPAEYISAASVAASKAVDGNADTLWISDGNAVSTAETLNTANFIKFNEIYAPRTSSNWGSRPQWIELIASINMITNGNFESGSIGTFWSASAGVTRDAVTSGVTAPHAGTYSMRVVFAAFASDSRYPRALNYITNYNASSPAQTGIEYHVVFWIKGNAGSEALTVRFLGTKADKQTSTYNSVAITLTTSWKRFEMWGVAENETIALSFYSNDGLAKTFYVDDVRFVGGAYLMSAQDQAGNVIRGQMVLTWQANHFRRSGSIEFDELKVEKIGGDRRLLLTDDEGLLQKYFFIEKSATIVQWRKAGNMLLDKINGYLELSRQTSATESETVHDKVYLRQSSVQANDAYSEYTDPYPSSEIQSYARSPQVSGPWIRNVFPSPGDNTPNTSEWIKIDLGVFTAPTLVANINASVTTLETSNGAAYASEGQVLIGTERIYYYKDPDNPETLQYLIRGYDGTTAASHTAGDSVEPYLDGGVQNLYYVSAIGWRRPSIPYPTFGEFRIGNILPVPMNYTILYSTATSPGDPDVGNNTWIAHPDWLLWANVHGNHEAERIHSDPEADRSISRWPDISKPDYFTGLRGTRMRWVLIGIHDMTDFGRVKLNEVYAFQQHLDAGIHGKFQGTGAADVKGILGHYLINHFGNSIDKFILERYAPVDVPAGLFYGGSMTIDADTYARVLDDLCNKIGYTWFVDRFNKTHIMPGPYNPLVGNQAVQQRWNTSNVRNSVDVNYFPKSPISQVQFSAYNAGQSRNYTADYPATPNERGGIKKVDGAIVGSSNEANIMARSRFAYENRGWGIQIEAGICENIEMYQHHIVNLDFDAGGTHFTNYDFIVIGFTEEIHASGYMKTKVQLEELTYA